VPPEIANEDSLHSTAGYFYIDSENIESFSGTLYLRYTDSALSESNIDEDNLMIAYYNPADSKWHSLITTIDKFKNIAAAEIDHFSIWTLTDKDEPMITGINEEKSRKNIETYILFQNYPNPFNPETAIKYQLPRTSKVNLTIYNILGQKIKTLVDEEKQAGFYSVIWDGTNNIGIKVSSGIYIYRMVTNNGFIEARKLVFFK